MKNRISFSYLLYTFLIMAVIPHHGRAQTPFWQKTAEPEEIVYSLAASGAGYLFAGAGIGSVYRSSDNGATWNDVADGGGGEVGVFPLCVGSSGYLYAGGDGDILYSSDGGTTWGSFVTSDPSIDKGFVAVHCLAYDGLTGKVLAGTDDGIHEIVGGSWNMYAATLGTENVHSVFVASTAGYLFVSGYYFLKRAPNVNNYPWVDISPGGMVIANAWTATPNGDIFMGTSQGVYVSTDTGADFLPVGTASLSYKITALASAENGQVYAGTDSEGVFTSTDYGQSWQPLNNGLGNLLVTALAIDHSGYLFASTWGDGVYRSAQTVTSVKRGKNSLPNHFLLAQNYPNPFNPTTVITYELPARASVTLKVYDVLGRVVTTLVSGMQNRGEHSVTFDAAGVPTGVYFYRLQARGYVETRKLTVLK